MAQRGIESSSETVRCWTLKLGRAFAQDLRRSRPRPTGCWHLGSGSSDRGRLNDRSLPAHCALDNLT